MLFRLQTTDDSLVVKRSKPDSPVAPVAIAVSLFVTLIGAWMFRRAGYGPAATVWLPIGFFSSATLLFMAEDRRRARALALEGSVFDRKSGRFTQDSKDVCALTDLDRVRLLETADCNGAIFELAVVTKRHGDFEMVGTYAAAGDERDALRQLGASVAEFCGLTFSEERG